MSDWAYLVIAYTVVWGALALYALLLARRVTTATALARALRDAAEEEGGSVTQERSSGGEDGAVCDAPPAP